MKELPRLYAITDRRTYGTDFLGTLRRILEKGVKMVQLREKDLPGGELYRLAMNVRKLTKEYGAILLINDRPDVAKAVGAEGVHLPEKGMPTRVVRKAFPDLLIGFSAHSPESAKRAEEDGADFVTISPVFKTSSHPKAKPLGPGAIREVAESVNIPVFALGGITWQKIKVCYKNGAYGVAGITMFIDDGDKRNNS